MKKLNALVMCLADPSGNPRPRRMIELLTAQGYDVDVSSFPIEGRLKYTRWLPISPPPQFGIRYWLLRVRGQVIKFLRMLFRSHSVRDRLNNLLYRLHDLDRLIRKHDYDLVVVEDLFLLPVAIGEKKTAKVLFDAREYYPRQNEESWLWRLIESPERVRLCKAYLGLCDHVVTVSPGLAAEFKREFGVDATVVRSVPRFAGRKPAPTTFSTIKMVHHGGANPNRQLTKMVDVLKLLDNRFSLDFYLVGSRREVVRLKRYIGDEKRVRVLKPVPFESIVDTLSDYDVGIFYVEPLTFNLRNCLPNKLFEFIQAGLAVAVGPSPNMAEIVNCYRCGVVAEEFSVRSMARALQDLTSDEVYNFKKNSSLAARELSFEEESKKILSLIGAAQCG